MNHKIIKSFTLLLCVELFQLGSTSAIAQTQQDSSVSVLLQQADYWHNKANADLAKQSLEKVLMVDANNQKALYMMALLSREQGDSTAAEQWKQRLYKAHPNSAEYRKLVDEKFIGKLSQDQVSLARNLARRGDFKAAIQTWDTIFANGEVPESLISEYYLTMSGDRSLYSKAVRGLEQYLAKHPKNVSASIAYGQVLSYRANTRRKGIHLLERYAPTNENADKALKQALLWLQPKESDKSSYTAWMKRHPNDTAVLEHYQRTLDGTKIRQAFNQLNQGDLTKAKAMFSEILSHTPKDSEALAGLGYVYLHENNYQAAANYLNQSAKQGGREASKRRKQAQEASFYYDLSQAKSAYAAGDVTRALLLTSSLIEDKGEAGQAAKLFRADVLRSQGSYSEAETLLRAVLETDTKNLPAKEALYYVLVEQNKKGQADKLLTTMPQDMQRKVRSSDNYSNIRDLANQAMQFGNLETAAVILEDGVKRLPNNPWIRLELARLYSKQGNEQAATATITSLETENASNESLYAAALYASGTEKWSKVHALLTRIPLAQRDVKVQQLYDESEFNLSLDIARSYIEQDNSKKALPLLLTLKDNNVSNPARAGRIAQLMINAGSPEQAVALVRESISSGLKGSVADYVDHISVLYQAGFSSEAQTLLNDPQLVKNSTPEQLQNARNVYVINEADYLRKLGEYEPAYDMLARSLQNEPENPTLMLAMARLYQSGNMKDNALKVYSYLLDNNLDKTEESRLGAIQINLDQGHIEKARQLFEQLANQTSPERLLLNARIYNAEGKRQLALAALRRARTQLLGFESAGNMASPIIGGLVMADNPFSTHSSSAKKGSSASVYGSAMPWQVSGNSSSDPNVFSERMDLPSISSKQQTLQDVNQLLTDIRGKSASWVQGGVQIRSRDGESGLSKLTETRVPLQWSTVPFGDSRLAINIDAVSLSSGASSGDANRRFGTGALIQGQVAQSEGLSSSSVLPEVDSQGLKQAQGIELKLGLSGDSYAADIGTTPLGLEFDTLVGGATYNAKMADNVTFSITGERRSVKDSLLSYVGVKDDFSGKYWGQVTKNGFNVQLGYDNSDAGYYANAGAWKYLGNSVEDNESIEIGGGFYYRPYHFDDRSVQIGLDLRYKDFSHNLSYYSYGHGGYFSPQNYVSFSVPVDYQYTRDKMTFNLGGSIGYQSYSEEEAAYFPGHASLQSQLESYVDSGYSEEAYYSAKSTAGLGFNIRASIEYQLQSDLVLQAKVGYDTFRDYNESIALLMLRSSFGRY
ncbi:BCSC C-terminal domain-containing protein [Vibrio tritonius]|uniref:BCSC C-terminal domain-containing protein n=1 Tax=Vibrio tritonius TaxID=1435069 RepID=A0ABS7YJC2_9VIBR|nr:cellulose biosynthesis protein BcsC [Vibrio tritonius]MCA2015147.1 BCSC C-terminal domain-containing protein [Vibrio tritonius]